MLAKKVVVLLGWIFIILGIVGFFNDPIIGLFDVDYVHNSIHIISGLLALVFAAKGTDSAKAFAKVFGVIYVLLGIAGLVIPGDTFFDLIAMNVADDILHIILGLVFILLGYTKIR